MQGQIILQGIMLEEFWKCHEERTRSIVKEEIKAFNDSSENEKFLSAKEVCDLLSISRPTLETWSKEGKLNKLQIKGRTYWRKSEVTASLTTLKRYTR